MFFPVVPQVWVNGDQHMAVENWKLWLVPFAIWILFLSWYSGYQSGYQEGHETAWEMSRPSMLLTAQDRTALDDRDLGSDDRHTTAR